MDFILKGFYEAFFILADFNQEAFSAIFTSIKVSSVSIFFSAVFGFPVGFILGYYDFFMKKTLRLVFDTLLSLPTVFVGLVVYAFITRHGPLGAYGMLFSIKGMAIGQFILSFPIIVSLTASVVDQRDENLVITLKSLGAKGFRFFFSLLFEIRHGLLTAFLTAYGRILTEVGVSMMVGGNIKWKTRTITTAIALETNKGYFSTGIALGLVLLMIALMVNLSLAFLRKK